MVVAGKKVELLLKISQKLLFVDSTGAEFWTDCGRRYIDCDYSDSGVVERNGDIIYVLLRNLVVVRKLMEIVGGDYFNIVVIPSCCSLIDVVVEEAKIDF